MPAEQLWPAFWISALTIAGTALSRSASAKTTLGDLPPSSSSIGTSRRAHTSATSRAGGGAADERHVVDAGVLGERGAGRAVAGRDLDHPARHARLLGELGEAQRRHRRQLGRLDDHRVAGRQRGRGAARGDLQRVVERDDLRAHAPRLAHRVVEDVRAERDLAAFEALDRARVVVEVAGGDGDVGLGLLERLAGVAGLELGQHALLGLDPAREPGQRLRADERRAPLLLDRERAVGVLDHLADQLGARLRQLGELVPGRRVDRHEAAHRSRPASTLKTAPVIARASSEAR